MLQRLVETYGWITILHKYLDSYLKTTTQPPSCKSLKRTKIWLKRGKYCAADIESLVVSIFAGRGREEFTPCLENSTKTSSQEPHQHQAQHKYNKYNKYTNTTKNQALKSHTNTPCDAGPTQIQIQKKLPHQHVTWTKFALAQNMSFRGQKLF